MIEEIVPDAVVTVEAFEDDAYPVLFPAEQGLVANAVAARRREFATGRGCARRALARLGIEPLPIPADRRGVPRWPDGVVGCITHCAGYRAAAVAWSGDVSTIGIDAEPNGPLPPGVLRLVARAEERTRLAGLAAAAPGVHADRLLFSAKESVFKAWYPLTRRELDFEDASVTFDPLRRRFVARVVTPMGAPAGTAASWYGRWAVGNGLLVTAVVPGSRT